MRCISMRDSSSSRRRSAPSGALLAAFVLAAFAVAGCEAPQEQPDPAPPAQDEPAPPATPPAEAGPMEAEIALEEVNGSGVSGEATAIHQDDAVTVVLELEGFADEGEYAAHIHAGSCETGGPVVEGLNPVLALADGTGMSTTILDADDIDEEESLFIQVHGEGGTPIACGDIEGHPPESP